jgi:hypothetical protein
VRCWCGGGVQLVEADSSRAVCLESKFHDPLATGKPDKITELYVAGPMSGYPECNYPAFNEAARRLREVGYGVANPAEVHIYKPHHYNDLIREDIRVMLECQAVATLENWWESVGARNEVQIAGVLKMPVRTVDEWVSMAYVYQRTASPIQQDWMFKPNRIITDYSHRS